MNKFFEALSRNVVATVLLVLAVIFIGYKLATMGPQAASLAMMAIVCTVFVLAYLVAALDAHKAELAKLLEPQRGHGSTSDAHDPYSAKAHRQRLESDAMQALAYRALDMASPVDAGNRMRQAIDAMLGTVPVTMCIAACKCGPNEGCNNCPRNVLATKPTTEAVMRASGHAPTADPVEVMIQAKGKTAPRITPADIEANIIDERYFTALDGAKGAYHAGGDVHPVGGSPSKEVTQTLGLLTFCVLTLRNGFTVTGESACASPENFDAEIGRKIARENAVNKIWPLMGYELRTQLAKPVLTEGDAQADLAGTRRPDNHVG